MSQPVPRAAPASRDEIAARRAWFEQRATTLFGVSLRLRARYLRAIARVEPAAAAALEDRLATSVEPEPDRPRIGPFRLVRRFGGGIVEVWLAVDERSDRPVIAKLDRRGASAGEHGDGAIAREVAASSALRLVGVPRVIESFRSGEVAGLIREFVPGSSLSEWIAHRRAAKALGVEPRQGDTEELLAFVARAARVVAKIHAEGWVHGDLKPGNLLLGIDGQAFVLDLGCASRTGSALSGAGTPAYAAPERLAEASPTATPALDVWALGVQLFEAVESRLPFRAADPGALAHAILTHPIPHAPGSLPPDAAGVAAVIRWALARRPARRCPSAEALAEDLERALRGEPTLAESTLRRVRRRTAVRWLASVALVIAALLVPGIAVQQRTTDRELPRLLATRSWIEAAEREADAMWPAWPENAGRLTAWIDRHAIPLRERRTALEARLRDAGEDGDVRRTLVTLEVFLAADTGTVAQVERRLRTATSIETETVGDLAAPWSEFAARVAADPRFAGYALKPLVGLVPLGFDAASALEEFHDVATARPGASAPVRDPSGSLQLEADHGLVFVLVPPCRFLSGEQRSDPTGPAYDAVAGDHARPEHIELAPFLIAKFEMTNAQWERLAGEPTPSYLLIGQRYSGDPLIGARHPVEQVSWELGRRVLQRGGLDLPTEAQWECAALAGKRSRWTFGDELAELSRHANVRDRAYVAAFGPAVDAISECDGFVFTAPVGSFAPNGFGLYDVHGNVAEWCRDTWSSYGAANPPREGDGLRSPPGRHRSYRGGSYAHGAIGSRSCSRLDGRPALRSSLIGLRPIRPLPGVGR